MDLNKLNKWTKKLDARITKLNNVEETITNKLSREIADAVDFAILYGDKIKINGMTYILIDSPRMFRHPDYKYGRMCCKIKRKL